MRKIKLDALHELYLAKRGGEITVVTHDYYDKLFDELSVFFRSKGILYTNEITPRLMIEYGRFEGMCGVATNTISKRIGYLKIILTFAKRMRQIDNNPLEDYTMKDVAPNSYKI